MILPHRVPIARIEGYYTKNIGSFDKEKMFMAFVVSEFSINAPKPLPPNWSEHKRWYAVVHMFESDGSYLGTKHWFAGTSAEGEQEVINRATKKLAEFIQALGPISLHDIAVNLFSTMIDGKTFGLIAHEDDECIELVPNGFVFYAPWDGSFDT